MLVASLDWTKATVSGTVTGLCSMAESWWEAVVRRRSTTHCHQPVKEASYIAIWHAGLKTFQVWIWTGRVALIAWKKNWKLGGRTLVSVAVKLNGVFVRGGKKKEKKEGNLPGRGRCDVLTGCEVSDFV